VWGSPRATRRVNQNRRGPGWRPRAVFNLPEPTDWRAVQGQWRVAPGLSPGEPHEGLGSQVVGSPARLPDDHDARCDVCHDLTAWPSHGLTFAWDRLTATLPDTVHGRDRGGARLVFETCLDDAGEIWIKGTYDREWGTVPGVHGPPRVLVTTDPHPGQLSTLAWLAVNGPLGGPGGTVFVRYACLACARRTPGVSRATKAMTTPLDGRGHRGHPAVRPDLGSVHRHLERPAR
jgi:hypothetical protein